MHIKFSWNFHQNVFTLTIYFIALNVGIEFVLIYRPHPVLTCIRIHCSLTNRHFVLDTLKHRFNMEVRSPKFIFALCALCTAVLIGWGPATPLPLHLGSYTKALSNISLCYRSEHEREVHLPATSDPALNHGSGVWLVFQQNFSVADPGCLSRIQEPDFYPSRIPDVGSRIEKQQWKTGVTKKLLSYLFFGAINFTKFKNYLFLKC